MKSKNDNSSLKKGLLVLDYDGTVVNEDLVVFEDLKTILPNLHNVGIEIVILTAQNWKEYKTDSLNAGFGQDRAFLNVPNDIYDVSRCSQEFFNNSKHYTKGDALIQIALERGYPKERVLFVEDNSEHINSAVNAQFNALQVVTQSKYNPTPKVNFFNETFKQAYENIFTITDKLTTLQEVKLIEKISTYLPLMACVNFSSTCKSMLKYQPKNPRYVIEHFDRVCPKVLSNIENYIITHKSDCTYLNNKWESDVGFIRALSFKVIFKSPTVFLEEECASTPFKLFALYLLLTEKNGVQLKAGVKSCLPQSSEIEIKKYLLEHYELNENGLEQAKKELIQLRSVLPEAGLVMFSDNLDWVKNGTMFSSIFGPLSEKLSSKVYGQDPKGCIIS